MNKPMKAAVVQQPGELVVRDVLMPEMGDYDALCEMLYGATCTGTDQHLIAGRFPWPVRYPTILGHESIGRVIAIGPRVRYYQVGDLVTRVGTPAPTDSGLDVNWGGYAQYGIAKDHSAMREDGLPQREWDAYRINQVLPPDFDPAASTMIITWRETLSYLTRLLNAGHVDAADATLLVVGSGGNGLAFVAHAHNAGLHPVVAVGSAARAETAQAVGADAYVDYRAAHWQDELGRAYPAGFDVIIDAVGKVGALDDALPLLKAGGTLGIYGIDEWGRCALTPTRARGTFTFYNGGYDEEETHAQVVRYIQQGKLRAEHWLDLAHPYDLGDIQHAFDALRQRQMVKAVVKLNG